MDDRPIGMFDSGFGGLTVARALIDLLPGEDLVYIGDTGRYPYGPRPLEEVAGFARQITTKLVAEHGVKMVVVACNTAAAAAIDLLRFEFDVPLIGVIEPGLRAAMRASTSGRIGVIGTVGTIGSGAYQRAAGELARGHPVQLTCAACPGFVEFVERGETGSDQVYVLAERLLAPVRSAAVDTLLLGCTHYPFLARTISDVVGRDVVLVDSADETAFEVRSILGDTGGGRRATKPGQHRWISSGDTATFERLGRRLLGPELPRRRGLAAGMTNARHGGPLAVTVLGCDGSYPGPGGAASGYLVTCEGTTVWLDAGPGTLANLQLHVPLADLDAIVLTHEHPDHWSDLEHFVVACRWFIGRTGVPVHAPPSLRAAAERIRDAEAGTAVLDWNATDPGEALNIGPLTLTFSRTDHPVPTHAVRVDAGGRSLGYSADSGPAWAMSSLGAGLDLALCEATFLSDLEGTVQHLSARQAGATAREAGVGRLVITHIAPGIDRVAAEIEAEAAFGAPVEVAGIGARYQL